jgi:STAM-binding protein
MHHSSVPAVDRSSKPSHFTATGGTTENKYDLRDVIVPAAIVSEFLKIALPNTNKNIETCGILCGQVVSPLLQWSLQ